MSERKQIKVFLTPSDHDRVRLAAAASRTSMADFCRQVVVAEATRAAKAITKKPSRATK